MLAVSLQKEGLPFNVLYFFNLNFRRAVFNSPFAFGSTFTVKRELEFESRFVIANFYFDEPLVTLLKKDSKISTLELL